MPHLQSLGNGKVGLLLLLEMLRELGLEDGAPVGDLPPDPNPFMTESEDPNVAFRGEPMAGGAPTGARSRAPERGTRSARVQLAARSGDPRRHEGPRESGGRPPRSGPRPTGPGLANALDRRVPADEPPVLKTEPGTARKRARAMFERGTPLLEALRKLDADPVTRGAIPEGEVKVRQTIARSRR